MAIVFLYGINSCGKDTIASILVKNMENCMITGESRLLMYRLGLINNYESHYPVKASAYKALEQVDSEVIEKVSNLEIPQTIKQIADKGKNLIVLSHLVYALFQKNTETIYLSNRPIPSWICNYGDCFVYIKSSPHDIQRRRMKDFNDDINRRKIQTLEEIKNHQVLSGKKWAELRQLAKKKQFIVVENNHNEAKKAANIVSKFISKLNKG